MLGLAGPLAVGAAMITLARLSARLGKVTHARPYYWGLHAAAALMWLQMLVRLYFVTLGPEAMQASNRNLLYTLLSDGLPAISVTMGLVVTWYYWSWLLAERD